MHACVCVCVCVCVCMPAVCDSKHIAERLGYIEVENCLLSTIPVCGAQVVSIVNF